jgi:hypothetical protein
VRTLRSLAACLGPVFAAIALMIVYVGPARAGMVGITEGLTSSVLWDINPSTGVPTNPRTVNTSPDRAITAIATAPSGKLFGVSQGQPSDVPSSGKLYLIDPATGTPTLIATLTQFIITEGDIATDPTSGLLYAVDGQGALFRINTSNGVCTAIGTLPGNLDLSAMAFDNAGNLFIWDSFGPTMYKVNKTNAAVISSVGLTPSPGGQIGGMAFDPSNGIAYLAANPGSIAQLSKVDPNTGAVTPIGSLGATGGIWGLAFVSVPTPTQKTSWGSVKARYH